MGYYFLRLRSTRGTNVWRKFIIEVLASSALQ